MFLELFSYLCFEFCIILLNIFGKKWDVVRIMINLKLW